MSAFELLKKKLQSGEALVGIIGLGYVGLPLAHALHQGGARVLGFDIDPSKIDALKAGTNYLRHLGDEMTRELSQSNRFSATTDFGRLTECDAIIICVPTPLGKRMEPDVSFVVNAGLAVGRTLRPGQLVCLESTSYPGTTREDLLAAMIQSAPPAAKKLQCGVDFFVAFSPEREDPGRKSHTTRTTPKLVGGLDQPSTDLAMLLYARAVDKPVRVSTAEVAEAAKLLENIYRAVNIALVNELKPVLAAMGIDIWEVIEAAATKPFGFQAFYPGPGLGGHCIPIDPFYLTWKAKEFGQRTKFIELAGEINNAMPHYVVERLGQALNEDNKPLKGSKVLIIGLAYKPNIDDSRETPAAEIITLLEDRGAEVLYHDPHVPVFPRMRRYKYELKSVPLTSKNIEDADAVLIVTNHDAIDYKLLGAHAKLIVDSRNAMKCVPGAKARIVKA